MDGAGLHEAGAGKSWESSSSHHTPIHEDIQLVAGRCSAYFPHPRTPCLLSEVGFLFYSGGSLPFAQKTTVQWDKIPVFLCVEPKQKMAISPALAHSSFFEIGLVTA